MSCSWLALTLAAPGAARAQDPPPPPPPPPPVDTLAADTLVAPADTLPPAPFVRFPHPAATAPRAGVWVWDRQALLAETALTLADLLQRLPGVNVVRTGSWLQPETALGFGGTADRIEVVRDGFIVDPLQASALDLSTIRLAPLAEVVIERRLDLLRITLRTDEPLEREPYSRVEAALGQPAVNLFRGILLAPRVIIGPFSAAVERLDTDGRRGVEPADIFETWAKWGWTRPQYGVQGEIRRWTLERRSGSPWPLREERREWVIRGRAAPVPGLASEAYVGRAHSERAAPGTPDDEQDRVIRGATQSGARAAFERDGRGAYAAVRLRSGDALARTQADIGGHLGFGTLLRLGADLTHTAWDAGPARLSVRAHGELSPTDAVRVFGEAAFGGRAAPFYGGAAADEVEPQPVRVAPIGSERTALRAGVEASLARLTVGGAALRVETDSVAAFGMPFDSTLAQFPGGSANGVEAWATVPVPRTAFAVHGWVTQWMDGAPWTYAPERSWYLALELAASPLESGNLEIRGRAEARHRGGLFAPAGAAAEPFDFAVLPAYTTAGAALYIRIIDVHIFGRYENVGDQALADVPGRPSPGPRFYYGVKWSFWN